MKRLLIAAGLLIVVIVACILSNRSLQSNTDYLLRSLDEMQDTFESGDKEGALRLAEQFAEEFPERTRTFPFFLHHEDVTAIEETAVTLPIMLQAGDEEHFPSEIARCRLQLEKLNDLELPIPENIL